jgi:hypothetical protein
MPEMCLTPLTQTLYLCLQIDTSAIHAQDVPYPFDSDPTPLLTD